MPDLITHLFFSHLFKRPFELFQKDRHILPFRLLLYLGTILPDILTRPWYIIFPATKQWTACLHTPLCAILFCLLLSQLFDPAIQKKVFINLATGTVLHFLLDAFQFQIIDSYFWLFPFSWKNVGYGLFNAGDLIPFIPLWILLIIILETIIYFLKHKPKKN